MTPQEKAKELVNKFKPYCTIDVSAKPITRTTYARQCALIAVDEIIKATGTPYWQNVKKELEGLL